MYDPAKAQANGDVASELGLANSGNVAVNGKIKIGPNGSYDLGPTGYVGPIGWTGPGIFSPDWVQTDSRFALPSVSPPYSFGFPIPAGSGTNYTILWNENYYVNGDFEPTGTSKTILVAGSATLYVTGVFLIPASWQIRIQAGAVLRLYVGKPNGPPVAAQLSRIYAPDGSYTLTFQYYGLPSNTSVTWNGNDAYQGIVYAPQATINIGGGGNIVYDYQGAVVANAVLLNGHFYFHYDENLRKRGPLR